MLTDTDVDSDNESTVFEAKKRGMNGSLYGYIRKDTWYYVFDSVSLSSDSA